MNYWYKGYCIEYISYRNLWRVYRFPYPQNTIAYCDSLEEAKEGIDFNEGRHNDIQQADKA